MKITSIIPGLLLLSCCAHARHIFNDEDGTALHPIMSQSSRTRICAELCMSGLGGTPCGSTCYDLTPMNLPISGQSDQNVTENIKYNGTARHDACDVLCKNRLGFPLCDCQYDDTKTYDTDFVQICSTFCVSFEYQIYGCQPCDIYQNYLKSFGKESPSISDVQSQAVSKINWDAWCSSKCPVDGGAACNCFLLEGIYGCQNCSLYKQQTSKNYNKSRHYRDDVICIWGSDNKACL